MVTDHSFPQGSGTTNWPLTCSSSARQLRARSLPKDAVPLAGFCCRLRIGCSIAIARGSARNRRKRQTVKRASLVVTLCAALCVSAGFAATKKSHRNNGPRDWNDLSLQNGDLSSNWGDLSLQNGGLPNAGRSVSSGSSGSQPSRASGGSASPLNPGTPDNWTGCYGCGWNTPGNWSGGLPNSNSDVTIYSGSDYVILDTSATINSLTLGGASGSYSYLEDSGVAQTLAIGTSLTLGQTGYLYLTGGTTVTAGGDASNAGQIYLYNGSSLSVAGNFDNIYYADAVNGGSVINVGGTLTNEANASFYEQGGAASIGSLVNNGYFYVGSGASVNLTSQPGGITDVPLFATYNIQGSFTTNGGADSGFVNLTSIEGGVELGNGQTANITPNGGTLTITGYQPGYYCYSSGSEPYGCLDASNGSTLNINGDVNNSGGGLAAGLHGGGGNTINIFGTLTNSGYGFVDVEGGSTLAVSGDLNNSYYLTTSYFGYGGGNAINIGGNLNNSGYVYLYDGGNTLTIAGDFNNSGTLSTSGGSNTIDITGALNNSGTFYLTGAGDTATANTLNNTGYLYVGSGATLAIMNQPNGIGTDVPFGASYNILGTFTTNGGSPFANVTTIEGALNLA